MQPAHPAPPDGVVVTEMRRQLHTANLGSQAVELPIVPLADGSGVPFLHTGDLPLSFVQGAAAELAERLLGHEPDAIVAASTGGLPIGVAVSAALGHDQCAVLHKSAEFHLGGAFTEWVEPTSSGGAHRHRLDLSRRWLIEGRRVAFVDDVVSTGASAAAALRLIRRAGGEVAAVAVLATEGTAWRDTLGADAGLVRSLGRLPRFRLDRTRCWVPTGNDQRPEPVAGAIRPGRARRSPAAAPSMAGTGPMGPGPATA